MFETAYPNLQESLAAALSERNESATPPPMQGGIAGGDGAMHRSVQEPEQQEA